jgi:hypothetical protein
MLGAAAAGVVLLVLIGYLAFGGSGEAPPAQDQTAVSAQTLATDTPAPPPTVPANPPAATGAVPPPPTEPAPSPAAPPPAAANANANAAAEEKAVEEARRTARRQLQNGDRVTALATAEGGLRLRGSDRDLLALVRQMQTDARTAAVAARGAAEAFGAYATSSPAFRAAEAAFADADRHTNDRRFGDAVRAFWLAEESFGRAAQDGKAAKDSADREAAEKARAATAAAAATPPPPPKPEPPAVNPDEAAIRAVMQRYSDAYTRSDANAVAAVTTLQAAALRKGFAQLSSQQMQLSNLTLRIESPTRARVEATLVHQMQPRAGAENTVRSGAVFFLEKRNGNWIIVDRKLQ